LQQGTATRTSQANISAALAAATANAAARIPSESRNHSLTEMAQRDLDAALQLLADRAQYITGSSGAAIALRRLGKKDMLCRASAGSNAPELGALLSTEFGLSGESVRTRQLLRCDDVERDLRVNREACRQLGIASVAVMPVVNDDEVLGVFELFSGKVNAFAERDLTALRRLSEMVETAVKLSRAAEQLSQQLLEESPSQAKTEASVSSVIEPEIEDPILEVEEAKAEFVADAVLPRDIDIDIDIAGQPSELRASLGVGNTEVGTTEKVERLLSPDPPKAEIIAEKPVTPELQSPKPLLWSIALDPVAGVAPPDQGQVPATLRNLRKCQACGFPVSPGRTFCVECEEKKWRGQLKPSSRAVAKGVSATVAAATAPAQDRLAGAASKSSPSVAEPVKEIQTPIRPSPGAQPSPSSSLPVSQAQSNTPAQGSTSEPELVLTAAMQPSQSWIGANKFVILVLLAIGAGAAILLLR